MPSTMWINLMSSEIRYQQFADMLKAEHIFSTVCTTHWGKKTCWIYLYSDMFILVCIQHAQCTYTFIIIYRTFDFLIITFIGTNLNGLSTRFRRILPPHGKPGLFSGWFQSIIQVSNENNHGWLGYIEIILSKLYTDNNKPWNKDPY